MTRTWVYERSHQPRPDNGEEQFSLWLTQRGEVHRYEPYLYPLQSGYSMRPDFWLPETATHPEFHFEITFLDKGLARLQGRLAELNPRSPSGRRLRSELRRQQHALARRWAYKQRKAAETTQQHGILVILVPYVLWRSIAIQPDLLDELMPTYEAVGSIPDCSGQLALA